MNSIRALCILLIFTCLHFESNAGQSKNQHKKPSVPELVQNSPPYLIAENSSRGGIYCSSELPPQSFGRLVFKTFRLELLTVDIISTCINGLPHNFIPLTDAKQQMRAVAKVPRNANVNGISCSEFVPVGGLPEYTISFVELPLISDESIEICLRRLVPVDTAQFRTPEI